MLDLLEEGISRGEELGAKLVEARFDDLHIKEIRTEKMEVKDVKTLRRIGIGLNIYYRGASGYSFAAEMSKKAVREAAENAFKIAKGASTVAKVQINPGQASPQKAKDLSLDIKRHPDETPFSSKKDLILRAAESSKDHGKEISSITGGYAELYGKKIFLNSEGTRVSWYPLVVDLRIMVVSKVGELMVNGRDGIGGSFGLEIFESDEYSPEKMGKNAAKWAAEKLEAKPTPPGRHRALCENHLAGVLAHESFGHLAESDFVVSGMSPLSGKLGSQLGSEHATIIDEGTPDMSKYRGFWIPFDDQGIRTKKTTIVNRGKLKNYLHNRETATMMKRPLTGNGRAVDYNFPPIVRMKNTYFLPGDLSVEEALEQLDTGIYAIQTEGGQANMDGTFAFKASRGYYVEGGEKKYPLREVMITGSILDFLEKIEGATKELILRSGYFGGCGKGGQYPLPVGVGGPHLLVREAHFGGEK